MERIEIEPASRLFAQQMVMGCLPQLLLAVAAHREMEPAVQLMRSQRLTKAELSRQSGIPETTLRDLLSGSVRLENCKAGTILRLARAFHVSVEELLMHGGEHPADYPEHRAQSVPEDEQTAFCALLHALSQLLPDS